jgi:hypothetical protein
LITPITVNGQTLSLVALPDSVLALEAVEFHMQDSVALAVSPFTGQTQRQSWLGADMWTATLTLPSQSEVDVSPWKAFLGELRGMQNPMLLSDPLHLVPAGNPLGAPAIPATVVDTAGSIVLHVTGFTPNTYGNLLRGDYFQVGYRLHMIVGQDVDADASGNATMSIWPSLREAPTANAPIILDSPAGLFGLSANKRGWSSDYSGYSKISIPCMEYR